MTFLEQLVSVQAAHKSRLCVGLDPDPSLMPPVEVFAFNKAIIDATADLVCCFKLNFAFYEALGVEGWGILKQTIDYIPANIPVLGDGKRGDVGHTARAYARAMFEILGCDAVTVNPYLGSDGIEPFAAYEDRGVFVLCKTSNSGSRDFQDIVLARKDNEEEAPLYILVARAVKSWNVHKNLGLVVGATFPDELRQVRELCPELPLLIPGIGAQSGDLEATVRSGLQAGGGPVIINSSRQVLYASRSFDFAEKAREEALRLRDAINNLVAVVGTKWR